MNGLAKVFGDWIREFKVDGFRVDTAKHVDRAFFKAWAPKILAAARAAGVKDFEIFGEVTAQRTRPSSRSSSGTVDFPTFSTFRSRTHSCASPAAPPAHAALRPRLADDDYFRRPDGIAPTPATFLGNHDMGRAALLIKQPDERDRGSSSAARLLPRVRAAVPAAGRARRLLRRRGGHDRPRGRQGRPPGHVSDAGRASGGRRSASAARRSGPGSSFDVDTVDNNVAASAQEPRRAPRATPGLRDRLHGGPARQRRIARRSAASTSPTAARWSPSSTPARMTSPFRSPRRRRLPSGRSGVGRT